MVELLVRVRDKDGEAATKRGDVIAWQPAGHVWGTRERSNPDWRIVRADITAAEANELIAVQRSGDPTDLSAERAPVTLLRVRAKRLDLDALGIATDLRLPRLDAAAAAVTSVTLAAVRQAKPQPAAPLEPAEVK